MKPFYDSLQPDESKAVISGLVWQTCAVFSVGEVLRRLRKAKNPPVGILQLAEQTGLNKGTLSRLERGEIDPKLSTLERIAKALDVPVAYLVTDLDELRDRLGLTSPVSEESTNGAVSKGGTHDQPTPTGAREPATRLEAQVEAQGREIQALRTVLDTLVGTAAEQRGPRKAAPVQTRRGKRDR